MKPHILIIGAGTAGLTIANRLARHQTKADITIIDSSTWHVYQPGLLLVPFGRYKEEDIRKPTRQLTHPSVRHIQKQALLIDPAAKKVTLSDHSEISYDIGVIATGARTMPQEIPGMAEEGWRKTIFDFYTWDGAWALRKKIADWDSGKLVMHITEMPIKCPVAPLEFCLLADDFFQKNGKRDHVGITLVTPLSGAFTKPVANRELSNLLQEKDIKVVADFGIEKVDLTTQELVSYDERRVPYNLLVTIPTNMGSQVIIDSKIGDELGFIPTDPHTLEAKEHQDLFVVGDASNVATSKAGSVAHFEVDIVMDRLRNKLAGKKPQAKYDGHTNCFVATGGNKAVLLDFNYEVEPVTGVFPWPIVGPLKLLKESRLNWWAKLMFRYIYWQWLIVGKAIPGIPTAMPIAGKNMPEKEKHDKLES